MLLWPPSDSVKKKVLCQQSRCELFSSLPVVSIAVAAAVFVAIVAAGSATGAAVPVIATTLRRVLPLITRAGTHFCFLALPMATLESQYCAFFNGELELMEAGL